MRALTGGPGRPRRVLQVVGNAVIGGAENHVLTLARTLDRDRYRVAVVCPRPGPLVDALREQRIPVHLIDMVRPAADDEYEPLLPALWALYALMRRWRPDVVHSHLYPAHLHATDAHTNGLVKSYCRHSLNDSRCRRAGPVLRTRRV